MNNQQEGMDAITLNTALEWQDLIVLWALEPQRNICVQMTYDDLFRIVNLIKKTREKNNELLETICKYAWTRTGTRVRTSRSK